VQNWKFAARIPTGILGYVGTDLQPLADERKSKGQNLILTQSVRLSRRITRAIINLFCNLCSIFAKNDHHGHTNKKIESN